MCNWDDAFADHHCLMSTHTLVVPQTYLYDETLREFGEYCNQMHKRKGHPAVIAVLDALVSSLEVSCLMCVA